MQKQGEDIIRFGIGGVTYVHQLNRNSEFGLKKPSGAGFPLPN
jgi:hypothetical protein